MSLATEYYHCSFFQEVNYSPNESCSADHQPPQPSQIITSHSHNSEQWHLSFDIPTNFSARAEEAISSGQITKRVRTEIVQSISSLMLIHTKTPTSDQYNTVCRKLIEKYPKLKDDIGSTGFVSIDMLLFYPFCKNYLFTGFMEDKTKGQI